LINDILDFSKLEAGQMKLDPIRFNLLSTVEDILELLASRAREKNLELLLRYQPGTPRFVVADPGRIRQVLFNLIGNAIKFTDTGYVLVHISLLPVKNTENQKWLSMRIEDTGIGIPENKIAALFEKFMQVESGSTRARQGTGLGLAICRNLVDLMKGNISVASTPGKGTVFSCTIPLDGADEPQMDVDHSSLLAGKRVLLVDDLAPNRLLYKETLSAAGIECLLAENVEEAISMLKYEEDTGRVIHAVVSDYIMPGATGIDLTLLIRSHPKLKHLPVVILSSAGERGLVKRFADVGVSACLAKPVARQQFFDTLCHIFQAVERGEKHTIITTESSVSLSVNRLLVRELPLYGTHILLAEDNRVNREITTEMLEGFGCKVSTAQTGVETVELARKERFDLIFMDCQMPVMDGFEATRHIVELKARGEIAPVPIIALTANAMKGDRERCLEEGMDDYLSKPMRKASLEAILLKWLRVQLEASMQASPAPPPQAAESIAASDDYGVDAQIFASAAEMLREKLGLVVSYYIEDADNYINRIAAALEANDPVNVMVPAHTLKSSSRQFGVTRLADLAARAEVAARAVKDGQRAEDMWPLLARMQEALAAAKPFFEKLKGSTAAVPKNTLPAPPASPSGSQPVPLHLPLVLMAGTQPEEFYTISRTFEYMSCKVLWATSAAQTLDLAAALPFSLILLSTSLPVQDISPAIRQLRQMKENKSIASAPVWVIASESKNYPVQEWSADGASQILPVPLEKEKLQYLCRSLTPFDTYFWSVYDAQVMEEFPRNILAHLPNLRGELLIHIRRMQRVLSAPGLNPEQAIEEIHAVKSGALTLGYMRIAALMANLEHMLLDKAQDGATENITTIATCLDAISLG
jgi:CheY-like chemotaxis protein